MTEKEAGEENDLAETLVRYRDQATQLVRENAVEIAMSLLVIGVGVGILVYQMQRRSRIDSLKRSVRKRIKKTGLADIIGKQLARVF